MTGAARRRMLVVDDEEPILFALQSYFESVGFEVSAAADLALARRQLAEQPPFDVVIADLRLAGVHTTDGLAVVAAARRRSAATRILVLTAYGSAEMEKTARAQGADLLLYKPRPLPEIARLVEELLAD